MKFCYNSHDQYRLPSPNGNAADPPFHSDVVTPEKGTKKGGWHIDEGSRSRGRKCVVLSYDSSRSVLSWHHILSPPCHCMPFSFHSFVNGQIEMDILKIFELNEVSVTAKIQTDNRHMSHGRFPNRFTAVELWLAHRCTELACQWNWLPDMCVFTMAPTACSNVCIEIALWELTSFGTLPAFRTSIEPWPRLLVTEG